MGGGALCAHNCVCIYTAGYIQQKKKEGRIGRLFVAGLSWVSSFYNFLVGIFENRGLYDVLKKMSGCSTYVLM